LNIWGQNPGNVTSKKRKKGKGGGGIPEGGGGEKKLSNMPRSFNISREKKVSWTFLEGGKKRVGT